MKPTSVLLKPLQKRTLYAATAILWISGLAWLLLSETHASRPLWMKIHGAFAMVFLIVFGSLLSQHVPVGWQQNRQRGTGISLLVISGILVLTGWGLYYIGEESCRHWTSLTHWIIGLLLPIFIFVHVWFVDP